MDKVLHDQFWMQFQGQPEQDITLAVNWIKGTLLVSQKSETELWKSTLLSYDNHRVVETDGFIQLSNDVPQIARQSLPWPPGSAQYNENLNAFNVSWTTSMEDANRLLHAAAKHQPFVSVNGTTVNLDRKVIEQSLSSIRLSYIRLTKLLDKSWNGN